jgi:hypothetical protein
VLSLSQSFSELSTNFHPPPHGGGGGQWSKLG